VPLGAGVSLAVHAAIVLSLASGAESLLNSTPSTQETVITAAIKYLLPPDKPGPTPRAGELRFAAPSGAEQAPPSQYVPPTEKLPLLGELNLRKEDKRTPLPLAVEAVAQNAFTLLDVDTETERDPDSAVPIYPPALFLKGIEGSALVRFVVDTSGLADIESFRIVEETHRLFGQAVRDALPRMKFRPATMGDKKVRQLVEQPFRFRLITRGMVETGRKP